MNWKKRVFNMGQEDRDWFREKRIDYDNGGLVPRSNVNPAWLVKTITFLGSLAIIGVIIAIIYSLV